MSKIFDEDLSFNEAWTQFHESIGAVIDRTVARNGLYSDVVCDQLLYVAASLMLEQHGSDDDGTLQAWCDKMIDYNEDRFKKSRELLDRLLAQQEAEKQEREKKG